MKATKENLAIAEKLRFLAQMFERTPQRDEHGDIVLFTCTEIDKIFGYKAPAMSPVRGAYAEVFEFDPKIGGNEIELWHFSDLQNIRVLMLCFAAAMAETGDLL